MKKRMVRRGKYSDGVRAREKSWYGNKREIVFVLQLSSTWVVEGGDQCLNYSSKQVGC